MRVLVLRQEKSILVVFDRRPQLIGLSVRADVLNSAKKRMDSFPGHIYIYSERERESDRREGILFLRLRAEGVCVCNEFE